MTSNYSDAELFVNKLSNFSSWKQSKQVDYIAYYLQGVAGKDTFGSSDIDRCFEELDLSKYSRTAKYLSANIGKSPKYVKKDVGYRLERATYDQIKKSVENEPEKVEVSSKLEDLVDSVEDEQEMKFLTEALNCFRIQAYRAFIVMIWIVTIDHLQRYVYKYRLDEFNEALVKNPDKRVKKIVTLENFGDLKESKFIELIRSKKVITNDVKTILDGKLGIRNSAAHPSGVGITGHKATEFALDLIDNVVLKYTL